MYTEGAQTTGYHRFLHHKNSSSPCPCQHCVHYEQSYGRHGGTGYQLPSARQTDHPSLDCRTDVQAPRATDVGGRDFRADRTERSGRCSPQRRPVYAVPGPYSYSDDVSQLCPWELNPAQWSYPLESGVRHFPAVREQCGCVVHGDIRALPFKAGAPHPFPNLQVKVQGHRHRRTVRYVTVDEQKESCECTFENYHVEPHSPHLGYLAIPNGNCGPRPVVLKGGEERDSHQDQDQGRQKGGSEDQYSRCSNSHRGFFSTEVPQKHLNQSRHKGPCVPASANASTETSKVTNSHDHQHQNSEVVKQKRRQDLVRDQIRQVVTDLEDVLGGLKQVHVEMKEVVEQIDRLTANIDLSEEAPCNNSSSNNIHSSAPSGDLRVALLPNHKPLQASQHDEDRIFLRTNSPSPVHTASVVKTSHFIPTSSSKDTNHERLGINGHPPQFYPRRDSNHVGQTQLEFQTQCLDPKVIIGNSTSTHKPPPYPQNGRCGKGPHLPPKPVRNPAYPGRGRQSTSMV